MKTIFYYITDHGKGHATRSIAVIRELIKQNIKVVIRNSNSKFFLKKSLPEILILDGITDVGPIIKNDGISINEKKSIGKISKWINDLDKNCKYEVELIQKYKPDLIISDISILPLLVSKKTGIPSITISNFSWFDVLKFIPKNKLYLIRKLYNYSNLHIQLPLSTPLKHFKNKISVGFISRKTVTNPIILKKKLRIRKNDLVVLIAIGNSKPITIHSDKNFKFLVINSKIQTKNPVIDVSDWIEGQDLVSIADLVICKCGYGFVSECLTNSTPFFYLASENHLEQKNMSKKLKEMGLNNKISLKEIQKIQLTEDFIKNLDQKLTQKNEIKNTISLIQQFLKR